MLPPLYKIPCEALLYSTFSVFDSDPEGIRNLTPMISGYLEAKVWLTSVGNNTYITGHFNFMARSPLTP